MEDSIDLALKAEKLGIRLFLIAYTPLNACTRTCLVPGSVIGQVQKTGCTFCGAMYFKITAADPELYLVPDASTLVQLEWKPEIAWVMGDLYWNGAPFAQCPRNILKNKIEEAKKLGYVMKSGVEAEFILLSEDRCRLVDAKQSTYLHNATSLLLHIELLDKINSIMEHLGWGPYRIYHEASSSQFEINFGFEDALVTADRLCFLKFMIKELARLENLSATFMPTPGQDLLCSNGLHINVSMWDARKGVNLFSSQCGDESRISDVARYCVGGMLRHSKQICALLCPTVNSYKRLNNGNWCPNKVCWGLENRSVMIRIPNKERLEHRLADAASNPHLAHAALLICALDGIQSRIEPDPPIQVPIDQVKDRSFVSMPTNLVEALQHLDGSSLMRRELGSQLIDAFLHLKRVEFANYSNHLCQWEMDNYFDC